MGHFPTSSLASPLKTIQYVSSSCLHSLATWRSRPGCQYGALAYLYNHPEVDRRWVARVYHGSFNRSYSIYSKMAVSLFTTTLFAPTRLPQAGHRRPGLCRALQRGAMGPDLHSHRAVGSWARLLSKAQTDPRSAIMPVDPNSPK